MTKSEKKIEQKIVLMHLRTVEGRVEIDTAVEQRLFYNKARVRSGGALFDNPFKRAWGRR